MSDGSTTITWLGHGTFCITTPEGKKLVIDPWMNGNPAFPSDWQTKLDDTAAIVLTHGHFDHVNDLATLATTSDAQVVGIFDLAAWLTKNGIAEDKFVGFNKGGTVEVAGVKITMTTAHHSSSIAGDDGLPQYLGDPCGYIMRFSDGCVVYHTGDTAVHMDMQLMGELYKPDVVILPIGDHFTMDPFQAAHALRLIGAKAAIPEHYGTFPILKGTPDELRAELKKLGVTCEVADIKAGESWTYKK